MPPLGVIPAPVCQTFFVDEEIQKLYSLDAVITVVDSKHIMARLNEDGRSAWMLKRRPVAGLWTPSKMGT